MPLPVSAGKPPAAAAAQADAAVVAVDLLPIEPLPNVHVIRGDFTTATVQRAISDALLGPAGRAAAAERGSSSSGSAGAPPVGRADVLLSDMAHSFTGDASLDHTRQMQLAWCALLFTRSHLRQGGHAAIKVRYGPEQRLFVSAARWLFRRVVEVKPPASRAGSAESYVVGLNSIAYADGGDALAWCADDAVRDALRAHGLVP